MQPKFGPGSVLVGVLVHIACCVRFVLLGYIRLAMVEGRHTLLRISIAKYIGRTITAIISRNNSLSLSLDVRLSTIYVRTLFIYVQTLSLSTLVR